MNHALLVLALLPACTFGGASSVVGRWQPQRIIDSTVCVQHAAGGDDARRDGCDRLISIGRDVPARRFSSLALTLLATGYMLQHTGDEAQSGVVFAGHMEYLRGRGRYALGARLGAQLSGGFGDKSFLLLPVSVVAHAGWMWGSVYAGVGYSPVSLEQQYVGEGEMQTALPAVYHHNSVHAFTGTRLWLFHFFGRGTTFNPELRVETFGDSTLISLTGNIGIYL